MLPKMAAEHFFSQLKEELDRYQLEIARDDNRVYHKKNDLCSLQAAYICNYCKTFFPTLDKAVNTLCPKQ